VKTYSDDAILSFIEEHMDVDMLCEYLHLSVIDILSLYEGEVLVDKRRVFENKMKDWELEHGKL
jgi:hypothetical protein